MRWCLKEEMEIGDDCQRYFVIQVLLRRLHRARLHQFPQLHLKLSFLAGGITALHPIHADDAKETATVMLNVRVILYVIIVIRVILYLLVVVEHHGVMLIIVSLHKKL